MSVSFDATDDSVETTSAPTNLGGSFAVGLWWRSDATHTTAGDPDCMFGLWDDSGSFYFFNADMRGTGNQFPQFNVFSGGSERSVICTTDFNDGEWHYMVCDFQDGTSGEIRIFVDDMMSSHASATGSYGTYGNASSGSSFSVGEFADLGRFWEGEIERVCIWDRRLTPGERYRSKYMLHRSGSQLAWRLRNEADLFDFSGNGRHGFMNSAPVGSDGPQGGWFDPYEYGLPLNSIAAGPSGGTVNPFSMGAVNLLQGKVA